MKNKVSHSYHRLLRFVKSIQNTRSKGLLKKAGITSSDSNMEIFKKCALYYSVKYKMNVRLYDENSCFEIARGQFSAVYQKTSARDSEGELLFFEQNGLYHVLTQFLGRKHICSDCGLGFSYQHNQPCFKYCNIQAVSLQLADHHNSR